MIIGIDATNIRGGGGITHLTEILSNFNKTQHNIKKIIVFGGNDTLNKLPISDWLEKKTYWWLNSNLFIRIFGQAFLLDKKIKNSCDILFSPGGDYFGSFKPIVSMSRNMLLYEKDERKKMSIFNKCRFELNYLKQKICFKNSSGIIFISKYAKTIILDKLDLDDRELIVIHHGVSHLFKNVKFKKRDYYAMNKPFTFVYVSFIEWYKHQWNVVHAISNVRKKGIPVALKLVGGINSKSAFKYMHETIKKVDPENNFIEYLKFIPYNELPDIYSDVDGIIFASTCENMPNIIIESMATGLPIACSDKNPMPEFLKGFGYYFNSRNIQSIESSIETIFNAKNNNFVKSVEMKQEVDKYNWENTSKATFRFIKKTYLKSI